MFKMLAAPIMAYNLAESFIDNVCRDLVRPKVGSILYCDLVFGTSEHSGVYVGNNRIVHLNGRGEIECVSPEEFIGGTTAISIYVSSRDGYAVGDGTIALQALSCLGSKRDYNVLLNNCHQFSSSCISGGSENSDSFLWMLKDKAKYSSLLRANEWRVWERPSERIRNSIDEFPAVPSLDEFIAKADGKTDADKALHAYMKLSLKTADFGVALTHVMSKCLDEFLESDMDEESAAMAGIKATQDILQFYYDAYDRLSDEADKLHESLKASV